jgi:hypothetical protein
MGTPVVPWILDVSGIADLSRPVRACRHLLSCAEATVIEGFTVLIGNIRYKNYVWTSPTIRRTPLAQTKPKGF